MKIKKLLISCFASALFVFCMFFSACDTTMDSQSGESSSSQSEEVEEQEEGSVSLSAKRIELDVGEEFVLTATISPSDSIAVWAVTDPSIAVVENGKVKGISNGETVVSVSIGEYIKASCTIVVKQKLISTYAVILSSENTQIVVGDIFALSATVKFGNMDVTKPKIVWTSSDETIATIDSKGVITALQAGKITLTAEFTTPDGNKVKAQSFLSVIEN